MRQSTAIIAVVLLACLGLAGTGSAQVPQPVQISGTIQAVNCETGQITMATGSGNDTFQATNQTTAYVNGTAISLCSLRSYVGDQAAAALIPTNNDLVLSQVNVTTAQARPTSSSSILSSPVAIGLGALLLGGIIGYIVGHNNPPAQTPVYYPGGYTTPAQAPVSYPYGYTYGNSAPAYYPYGYAPAYLPSNYPYNRPYYHQGHNYYRCTDGGWSRDRSCGADAGK